MGRIKVFGTKWNLEWHIVLRLNMVAKCFMEKGTLQAEF